MVKFKTNKAVSKRFKKTATGKFLYKAGGKKHLNAKMRAQVKRKLRRSKVLNKANTYRLAKLIP